MVGLGCCLFLSSFLGLCLLLGFFSLLCDCFLLSSSLFLCLLLSFNLGLLFSFELSFLLRLFVGLGVYLAHLFGLLRGSRCLRNLGWSSSFGHNWFTLFNLKGFVSLLLLLNFQHLQLSFSLSSLQLVLPLQSGEVGFGGGFLGCSLFGLLDGLSSKEFLLFLFSL